MLFVKYISLLSTIYYFVDCDLLEFCDRLWMISKQRKVNNSFSMSSVYLFRGKSKSSIEVNFNFGIYLNLDGIKQTDLQISPTLPRNQNEVIYII